MVDLSTIFWAFIGGMGPAILWLLFWLREDRLHPEPRLLIIKTFVAGCVAVLAALFLERFAVKIFAEGSLVLLTTWSLIEEGCKFFAAWVVALRTKANDEPVDAMIYLVTAALGFAALENALFLLTPLGNGDLIQSLITGNLRFIGSSLLHVVASGVIGIFIAYSFCELPTRRRMLAGIGLILAVILHAYFNFSILNSDSNLFVIFGFVWVGVVLLILFFERVKQRNRTCIVPPAGPSIYQKLAATSPYTHESR
jgi:RsiW-degrading membrane proteinase PrsW (M82 family)